MSGEFTERARGRGSECAVHEIGSGNGRYRFDLHPDRD
jgi:hypothetical protein